MNRFLLAAAIGLFAAGCGKAGPSKGSPADSSRQALTPPADSQHQAAKLTTDSQRTVAPPDTTKPAMNDSSDITGAYFPIGKLPAEFSELYLMNLATIDENANPSPLNGFLRPQKQSAKDYHLMAPKMNGNDLNFTTETINGVSYGFTGTFAKLGDFSANPPGEGEPILKGTLKKMKNGAMVAETPVTFSYSAGG